ncbi:hypothetical protein D3C75_173520 [compost metagenome]
MRQIQVKGRESPGIYTNKKAAETQRLFALRTSERYRISLCCHGPHVYGRSQSGDVYGYVRR